MKYDISIVIVNYNGKKYIDILLLSLLNQNITNKSYEVVIVDNNSQDDSCEYITENYIDKYKNIKLVSSNKNLGFAGGNNLGVDNCSGEFVVFLNNDTRVDKNWLNELVNCISETDAGIVNSKLLFFYDYIKIQCKTNDKFKINKSIVVNDKKIMIQNKFCNNLLYEEDGLACFGHSYFYLPIIKAHDSYKILINGEYTSDLIEHCNIIIGDNQYDFNDKGICKIDIESSYVENNKVSIIQNAGSGVDQNFNGYDIGFGEIDEGQYDCIKEINNACGASMIIKKTDFIASGKFDEKFFMYYEDTDLSYRMKKLLGKKILYCPTSKVRHIHTGSSEEWSPFFVFYVFRNRLLFIRKHMSFKIYFKELFKHSFYVLKSIFSNEKKDLKLAKLKSLIAAIL